MQKVTIIGLDCEIDLGGNIYAIYANGHDLEILMDHEAFEILQANLEHIYHAQLKQEAELAKQEWRA